MLKAFVGGDPAKGDLGARGGITAEITVQVAALEYDTANDPPAGAIHRHGGSPSLRTLYTATRPFPADVNER